MLRSHLCSVFLFPELGDLNWNSAFCTVRNHWCVTVWLSGNNYWVLRSEEYPDFPVEIAPQYLIDLVQQLLRVLALWFAPRDGMFHTCLGCTTKKTISSVCFGCVHPPAWATISLLRPHNPDPKHIDLSPFSVNNCSQGRQRFSSLYWFVSGPFCIHVSFFEALLHLFSWLMELNAILTGCWDRQFAHYWGRKVYGHMVYFLRLETSLRFCCLQVSWSSCPA